MGQTNTDPILDSYYMWFYTLNKSLQELIEESKLDNNLELFVLLT